MNQRGDLFEVFMYAVCSVFLCGFLATRGSCVSPGQAHRALDAAGYDDIKIVEHQWFAVGIRGCGSDAAKFVAKANNPRGKPVTVSVCVGWPFKGATIRTP